MKTEILFLASLALATATASVISSNLRGEETNASKIASKGCCSVCDDPTKEKYYSIVKAQGKCGECCMKPSHYKWFKILEPGKTIAYFQ